MPPEEAADESTNVLQDDVDALGLRYVKVQYRSAGTDEMLRAWIPLERQPIGGRSHAV